MPSRIAFSTLAFPDATLAAAISAGRRWGYSGAELRLIDGELVYLQVKDALAATGEVVPAGQGDGQMRETLAALRDSGFAGFMSLEPHLASAGRFGGFSGPEAFSRAVRALKSLLSELGIPWH